MCTIPKMKEEREFDHEHGHVHHRSYDIVSIWVSKVWSPIMIVVDAVFCL